MTFHHHFYLKTIDHWVPTFFMHNKLYTAGMPNKPIIYAIQSCRRSTNLVWKFLSHPVLECKVGGGSKGHQRPPYISRALLLYKSGLIKYSRSLARSITASCFFSQTAALEILLVFWLKPERLVERGTVPKIAVRVKNKMWCQWWL